MYCREKEGGVWSQLDELNHSQSLERVMHPALGWQLWDEWRGDVVEVILGRRK